MGIIIRVATLCQQKRFYCQKGQVSQILNIIKSQVKRLGIDEIFWVKGQGNYLAVLGDLDTYKPIEIVKSRRIE